MPERCGPTAVADEGVAMPRLVPAWCRILCSQFLAGVVALAFVLVPSTPAHAQPGNLRFFRNYFVTGGHFATGISLKGTGQNGFASGTIQVAADEAGTAGVPADSDVVAAFLYWQTVTDATGSGAAGAMFNGRDISVIAKNLNPSGTPPCWSSGGATGGGAGKLMKSYRADVLPFLPIGANGKRTAVGSHTVRLPDSGTGNSVPSTAGATLVLVFRDPTKPLTGIVIYDGGHAMNQGTPSFTQTLQGWYQAADASPVLHMTQIVANGQSNFTELLTVKDSSQTTLFSVTNPFVGPNWDTYSADVPLPPGAESATVKVARASNGSFDCLSWGAVVVDAVVQDTDRDGIVDRLESAGASGTVFNPAGQRLPDLYAMGARPDRKDIFVELGFMRSTSGYTTPLQTVPAGHTHVPPKSVIETIAKAYKDAPVDALPGGGFKGIRIHFDAGGNYQPSRVDPETGQPYPPLPSAAQCESNWQPSCAIIPASLAGGGEVIEETPCAPAPGRSCLFKDYPGPRPCSTLVTCQFDAYPGTVGWKSGFETYKNEPLDFRRTKVVGGATVDDGPDEAACAMAESDVNADGTPNVTTNCHRRFDRSRIGIFHYSLWAHAVGIPRGETDDPLTPIDERHTPRNMSGIGDYAGGAFMIALGQWDGGTGSTFFQASTFMHELGHNLALRHGGRDGDPNCKPNYESVMNYLFQVRGLIDASGVPRIGYSRQVLGPLNEAALNESAGLGTMLSRTRWYAPWSSSYVDLGLNSTPATKRCNGAPVAGEMMARIDGAALSGPIDWNANGVINGTIPPQDLNFSGSIDALPGGFDDWAHVDLRQLGTGRNVGGWSLDSGFWDSGFWDSGISDPGFWDSGFWDSGFWDSGFWDSGFWDSGFWDSGAEGDDAPVGELDLTTAETVANPPGMVRAVQAGKDVQVSWDPPHVGQDRVQFYEIYRLLGTGITAANFAARVPVGGSIVPPATSVLDLKVKKGTYIYIALAQFTDGRRSSVAVSAPVVVQ
jgi:hypothetical protein